MLPHANKAVPPISQEDLEAKINVALGGRAAEEVVYGTSPPARSPTSISSPRSRGR
jgi:ATP-dependent Zn protease